MSYSVNTTPLLDDNNGDGDGDNDSDIDEILQNPTVIQQQANHRMFKINEPKDKYNLAYIIFYILGMVTLLPWNFFVTADDYWSYKFRDISNNTNNITTYSGLLKRTSLQASFTSYISVASALPTLIFLTLNTVLSQKISLNKRVIGSLVLMLILFLMTLCFVLIDTDKWQDGFFILTITTIVLLNICSAVLSGSIFGVVGRFCPIYITATISGQALGGIFAAIAEIISLSIGATSQHSALCYFIIGNLTIIVSIISYIILSRTIFFKYHYLYESKLMIENEFENELIRPRLIDYKLILKKIFNYGISMLIVFAITLAIYPGVTVLIESEGKGHGRKWNDVFFVPTINYLLFNIGDYLGRILAGKFQRPRKGCLLLILSCARFIFIPLLLLCNAQPRHYWAVVFDQDYQYISIIFLFAITNGYLANIIAIQSPRLVEPHEKEIASSILTVFMGVGLSIGSGICLLMVKLL